MVTEFWAGAAAMAAGPTPVGTSLPFGCTPRKIAATIIAVMPRVTIRRMLLPPHGNLSSILPLQHNRSETRDPPWHELGLRGKEAARIRAQAYGTPQSDSLGSQYVCRVFDVGL